MKKSEEFIENLYKVNIVNKLKIDCKIKGYKGFRERFLSTLNYVDLNKKLIFFIKFTDVKPPFKIM